MQYTSNYPFYDKIDHRLRKRGTRDHEDGNKEVFVRRRSRRGHLKGRGCWMLGRDTLMQMENRLASADRTQSFVSNPYIKEGILQLSQQSTVSV